MDDSKRKEIVDFALTERIESLLRLCDGHVQRNSDLIRRFGLQETRITDLEKRLVNKALRQEEDRIADLEQRLVNKARDHVICTKERNTLRARVAELESVEEELKTRLAEITKDRDQIYRISYARADTINAAIAALKS